MTQLIGEFADRRPEVVVRRGGETFIDASAVLDLVNMADERGVAIVGLEGFLVSDDPPTRPSVESPITPTRRRVKERSVHARC
jgi:hypothetical protein